MGKEAREKYGDQVVEASNQAFRRMTESDYQAFVDLSQRVIETFIKAYRTGDPTGELAMEAAKLHQKWLMITWNNAYNAEAHRHLAQLYVDDERFRQYYDQYQEGLSLFIRDVIVHYVSQNFLK